jgi:branched-chain amino acid transport system ATP-binding protein
VLLVDHNVKSVAALVDRVLAMYLGERTSPRAPPRGDAQRDGPRVYLGGKIEARRGRTTRANAQPLLDVDDVSVSTARRRRSPDVSISVGEGEFVSIVGLNGAGKTTLFNAISGLVPYRRHDPRRRRTLRGRDPGAIARAASCSARRRASCSAT